MKITGKHPLERPVLLTFDSLVFNWRKLKDFEGATVGVLWDKLKEHGYKRVGGKLKITI
jgi:hypothetical protein